jgi:hypothetical protein
MTPFLQMCIGIFVIVLTGAVLLGIGLFVAAWRDLPRQNKEREAKSKAFDDDLEAMKARHRSWKL